MSPDDLTPENERGGAAFALRPEVVFFCVSSLFIVSFWIWFLFMRSPTDGVEKAVIQGKAVGEILAVCNAAATMTALESLFDTEDETTKPAQFDILQAALGITLGKHIIPEDNDLPLNARLATMPPNTTLTVDPSFFDSLIVDNSFYTQQYQQANWLSEKSLAKGKITFLANLEFIENNALNEHDHAQFFWYMVHSQHAQPQTVWLVHQDDMPPLWKLIWQQAWALVLTLALFVPMTLMALIPRFGAL